MKFNNFDNNERIINKVIVIVGIEPGFLESRHFQGPTPDCRFRLVAL